MSAWKSRWSWVRLVNSATSKWIASARCSASACEDTSITQARSPAVQHPPEGRLQVDRLRRRPLDLLLDPADHLLHRPQQPALDPRRLEDLPHQEGRRRLPIRPGDPDHPQLRRRIPIEPRRQRRHRRPRVRNDHLRHLQLRAPARPPAPAPPPPPPPARTHAHRPSPRARRRTASRAPLFGCRKPGRYLDGAVATIRHLSSRRAHPVSPAILGESGALTELSTSADQPISCETATGGAPDARPCYSGGTPR